MIILALFDSVLCMRFSRLTRYRVWMVSPDRVTVNAMIADDVKFHWRGNAQWWADAYSRDLEYCHYEVREYP